jgi:thiamine-phosphate diphosphorylase
LPTEDVGARRRAWLARTTSHRTFAARPNGEVAEPAIRAALQRGTRMVMLKETQLSPPQIVQAARGFRRICDAYDSLFVVCGRPDLALVCGADGVHLEPGDADTAQVRRFVGDDVLIGVSAYDQAQLEAAAADAALDYAIDPWGAIVVNRPIERE